MAYRIYTPPQSHDQRHDPFRLATESITAVAGWRKMVALDTGGNIDRAKLAALLAQ